MKRLALLCVLLVGCGRTTVTPSYIAIAEDKCSRNNGWKSIAFPENGEKGRPAWMEIRCQNDALFHVRDMLQERP